MKRASLLVVLLLLIGAVVVFDRQAAPRVGEQPVLVELFTSQGCSSCPPADELLRKIARDPNLRGRAIPLAFHVDYWDHLGWRDPFSSRAWSERQGEYSRSLKLNGAYTPQVVINGTRQMVGSSSGQIYKAIVEESQRAGEGSVSLTSDGDDYLMRANSPRGGVEVMLVIFEDGASTKVESGENGGRTIANDSIVRTLRRAATLDAGGTIQQRIKLRLNERLGAAAFLQDVKTRRVLAATVVTPPGA
jgi:hypothetical protein